MPTSRSPEALEALFAERQVTLATLAAKGAILAGDLLALDRIARCTVANEHWQLCDAAAREALLHDEHPHVRSCAVLAC